MKRKNISKIVPLLKFICLLVKTRIQYNFPFLTLGNSTPLTCYDVACPGANFHTELTSLN